MKQSADEKFEQQKETITRLYTVEGLSGRQIASDLHLNRPRLYKKIQEWGLLQPVSALSDGGSQEATDIGTLLEQGCSMAHIAEEMNLSPRQVRYRIEKNPALHLIWEQNKAEHLYNHPGRAELRMQKSSRDYCVENLPGEEWCPIEEFPLYEISNMGRVRRLARTYNSYFLIRQRTNADTGRIYVMLHNEDQRRNCQVARLVAKAFVPGYDAEKAHLTVNHNDGDVTNNAASNLSWMTQGDNARHAYRELNRPVVRKRRYQFSAIRYQDQNFTSVLAFSRYLGKSETQTRRYIDQAERFHIELLP